MCSVIFILNIQLKKNSAFKQYLLTCNIISGGCRGCNHMVVGFATTYAIVVSSNTCSGEVYSIQHYVIKFVSDLRQVGGFLPGTAVSSTNKTDRCDITEILLTVVLSTINSILGHLLAILHITIFSRSRFQ